MVPGVSVTDGDAVWSLRQGPIGEFPAQTLKILKQSLLSSTDNYPAFEILFGLLLGLRGNGMLTQGLPRYHAALATHHEPGVV